jgi:hypothetical protein
MQRRARVIEDAAWFCLPYSFCTHAHTMPMLHAHVATGARARAAQSQYLMVPSHDAVATLDVSWGCHWQSITTLSCAFMDLHTATPHPHIRGQRARVRRGVCMLRRHALEHAARLPVPEPHLALRVARHDEAAPTPAVVRRLSGAGGGWGAWPRTVRRARN